MWAVRGGLIGVGGVGCRLEGLTGYEAGCTCRGG